jgi:hypothetical protein
LPSYNQIQNQKSLKNKEQELNIVSLMENKNNYSAFYNEDKVARQNSYTNSWINYSRSLKEK